MTETVLLFFCYLGVRRCPSSPLLALLPAGAYTCSSWIDERDDTTCVRFIYGTSRNFESIRYR